jgi:hypothetical protein
LNSEDIQFQAEMDHYDKTMAIAQQAVENERQRQELERQELEHPELEQEADSESDLSVLASSLFNGMEGIELGGGIEIGQDNQVQEFQNAQEIGGIDIGGQSEAQSTVNRGNNEV